MLQNNYLKDWSNIVSSHFSHLSLPQVTGLATWSFGMVFTGSSSITRVSTFIPKINGEKTNTVRRRLKEWYQETNRQKGKNTTELDVIECFAPLLQWIVSLWNSEEKWLLLAIDATYIGQSFTILSIDVLYNGCAIRSGLENC